LLIFIIGCSLKTYKRKRIGQGRKTAANVILFVDKKHGAKRETI